MQFIAVNNSALSTTKRARLTTHAQQTLHKVFEKNISNLEFSTFKVSVIVFKKKNFQQKGIYEWE